MSCRNLTAVFSVLFFSSSPALSQEAPKPNWEQNAALVYWQAFSLMPELSPEEAELRMEILDGKRPLNEDARKLVLKSKDALAYMHRGAKLENAVWGVVWDLGPYALLPHLSKARELARLAALRAHVHFADGEHRQAVDDLFAAMTLGRHVAKEGVIVLIPLLVDYAIESICLEALARHLPESGAPTRINVERRLASLPKPRSLSDAFQGEKDVFLTWLIEEVKKPEAKARVVELVGNVDETEVKAFQSLDENELLPAAHRMGGYYDRMIEFSRLPIEDVKPREEELMKEIKNNGAKDFLSRWLLPNAGKALEIEAGQITRRALFQAGLAVVAQGEKAVEDPKHRDPFADGPFTYKKTSGGFVLTSAFERNGKNVTMQFGK